MSHSSEPGNSGFSRGRVALNFIDASDNKSDKICPVCGDPILPHDLLPVRNSATGQFVRMGRLRQHATCGGEFTLPESWIEKPDESKETASVKEEDKEKKAYAQNTHRTRSFTNVPVKLFSSGQSAFDKTASTEDNPLTGPLAIKAALEATDLEEVEKQAKEEIKSGRKSGLPLATRALAIITGLKKNNLKPADLMINAVPVIPPSFRPFAVAGDTFIPGDANELYANLIKIRDAAIEEADEIGKMSTESRRAIRNSIRALYGTADPIDQNLAKRGVSGFLRAITGAGPKFSYVNRKLLSKPQDFVARGTIVVDPELGMNEIGMPEDMVWDSYAPHIQKRLVQRTGLRPAQAVKEVKDRTPVARKALLDEIAERPVIYSRSPAWHKYNIIAAWPKLIEGDVIKINPLVTTGMNADFDGDEVINQVLVRIPNAALPLWRKICRGMDNHEIRFLQNSSVPDNQNGKIYLFDLEDFPHGKLLRSKKGAKGRIDFHSVPYPIQVLAYDEKNAVLKWADVAFWSRHYQREIEIVDTHSGYQLVTDDDPRAVYGTAAGKLDMQRFTPVSAVTAKVLIPRARRILASAGYITEIPGMTEVCKTSNKTNKMKPVIPLNAATGWFLGAICGKGWIIKSKGIVTGFAVSDNDGFNIAKLRETIAAFMLSERPVKDDKVTSAFLKSGGHDSSGFYRFRNAALGAWLLSIIGGVRNKKTPEPLHKHLPPFYLSAPEEFRSALLCGLLDTCGSIFISNDGSGPRLMVHISGVNIRLCIEIKLLAASLGICGRITSSRTLSGKPCWMLVLNDYDIQRWGGPFMAHQTKLKTLREAPRIKKSNVGAKCDIVPISQKCAAEFSKIIAGLETADQQSDTSDLARSVKHKLIQSLHSALSKACNPASAFYGAISRRQAIGVIKLIGRDRIAKFAAGKEWLRVVDNKEITWERVVAVQKTGIKEDGYDLTVPGYETFMSADGIILSNTVNIHVPATKEGVEEATTRLMPDKMVFSERFRDKLVPLPKQEMVLGLYGAKMRPPKTVHRFSSRAEAEAAIEAGKVPLRDEVEFPGS